MLKDLLLFTTNIRKGGMSPMEIYSSLGGMKSTCYAIYSISSTLGIVGVVFSPQFHLKVFTI